MAFGTGYLIHIIPTLACNLRCPYCYTNAINTAQNQNDADGYIERVGLLVNNLPISATHIEGGEPFIYPHLTKLLKMIREKERVYIVTNGYFVTDEKLREIISLGIRNFIVSVDYLASSGERDRKSCIKSLEIFNRNGIAPEVSVTMFKQNLGEFDSFFSIFNHYRIKGIRFGDVVPVGYAKEFADSILTADDYQDLLPRFFAHALPHTDQYAKLSLHGTTFQQCGQDFIRQYEKIAQIRRCDRFEGKLSVLPNGDVYTCFNLVNIDDLIIGNIWTDVLSANILPKRICGSHPHNMECPVEIGYHVGFSL